MYDQGGEQVSKFMGK